jgi:peptide/nickel transport system substrate-binding protein
MIDSQEGRRMTRRWTILLLAFVFLLAPAVPNAPAAPAPAPAPRAGGILVYATEGDPDRLDPNLSGLRTSQIVFFQLFEPLIVRDPADNTFKPWLAQSWEVSPDGKAYTFRLRRDVKFHDGTPFNAEAVKFNMERTHDPALATRCGGCAVGFYDGTDVVDPFTVRIRLKTAWAPFLDAMSLFYRMVSPDQVRKVGHQDFGRQPVGTGSFRFVEWIPNNRIVLERNPDHAWAPAIFRNKGRAYVDRVIFRIVPEPSTRVAGLESGEIHIATAVPAQDFARLSKDARFQAVVGLSPGIPFAFAVNVTKAPTNEINVRRAVAYGIDREIIAKASYQAFQPFGAFRPAYTLLSHTTWGYDKRTETYEYDPDRARALLEEAGWRMGPDGVRTKGGQRLEIALNSWEHGPPELMQAHLRRIGISLKIGILNALAVNEAQRKAESHMSPLPAARTDPDVLSAFMHSRNVAPRGFNFSFTTDTELDTLFDQAATEVNIGKRKDFYVAAIRLALSRAYMIPVHNRDNVSLVSARVQGLRYDVTGFFPWNHEVSLAP